MVKLVNNTVYTTFAQRVGITEAMDILSKLADYGFMPTVRPWVGSTPGQSINLDRESKGLCETVGELPAEVTRVELRWGKRFGGDGIQHSYKLTPSASTATGDL